MWKIAGPEEIIRSKNRRRQHAGPVILVSEECIPPEVFAGRKFVDITLGVEGARPAEPIIDLLDEVGDPADIKFRADNFQFRIAVEDAGQNQITQELLSRGLFVCK